MNSIKKYLKIDKKRIYFLNFLFDAYEGIARVQTISAKDGLVLLHIARGCEKEVDMLISAVSEQIRLKTVISTFEVESKYLLQTSDSKRMTS